MTAPQQTLITASWQRSEAAGLSRDARPSPEFADIYDADPLLDAARPVLAQAASALQGTETALLLMDQRCRLVSSVSGGSTLERTLRANGIEPGARVDEDSIGTTALGTVAEVRGQVTVHGADHYLEQFRGISCFGQPIIHPVTRRLAGVLCLAESADQATPLSVPMVRSLVDGIGERLLSRSNRDKHLVLSAFERATAAGGAPVVALGHDVQLTNARAARLLDIADMGLLRMLVNAPDGRMHTLSLSSGAVVEVLVERLPGIRDAALFTLREAAPAEPAGTPAAAIGSEAAAVAVFGEPGSGRTTRARTLLAGRPADELDVAARILGTDTVDVTGAVRRAWAGGRSLLVDGVDLLDDRSLALLAAAVERAVGRHALVLVAGDDPRPAVASLLHRCGRRVETPPLRRRPDELAALAQAMLTRLREGAPTAPALTGPAVDALLSRSWPGNLRELHAVLERAAAAAAARGTDRVDVGDLPTEYRTTTRAARLSGREQAERLAIIEALEAAGGNKVHAARALGISRTTLYARIRALGVDL
ncbi:sigma-54-dependent Fis family transcriptional regulator [Gordonia sp. VNK21]|uniref:sigma-54-dependent Fis family transcriptional regulator n=1 Tax=Gordonia sp. VNK21 TaxID=3382483 RepID=UPI0038D44ABE